MPVAPVELVGDDPGPRRHRVRVPLPPGRAHPALDDVHAHAGLFHHADRLERLAVEVAANHVHRLVVRDLIAENRDELPAGKRRVITVLLHDLSEREIGIGRDEEVLLRLVVALRLRQLEVEHLDLHGNGANQPFALRLDFHLAPIQPRLRVLRDMRRQEELAERLLRQRDRLQRRRVAEVLAHRVERVLLAPTLAQLARIHLSRRIEPLLGLPAVLPNETRVVRLGLRVDADEVLVVHQ